MSFNLKPYKLDDREWKMQHKSKYLGKHAGYCECGLMFATLEIGKQCKRCGRIYAVQYK